MTASKERNCPWSDRELVYKRPPLNGCPEIVGLFRSQGCLTAEAELQVQTRCVPHRAGRDGFHMSGATQAAAGPGGVAPCPRTPVRWDILGRAGCPPSLHSSL